MIDTVAQEMDERVFHLLQNALVDLDFLAAQHEIGVLTLIAAQIAHQFRERCRERAKRQQEQLLGFLQQIVHELADEVTILLRRLGDRRNPIFQ